MISWLEVYTAKKKNYTFELRSFCSNRRTDKRTLDGCKQQETQYSYESQHCEVWSHPLQQINNCACSNQFNCRLRIAKERGSKSLTGKRIEVRTEDSIESLSPGKENGIHSLRESMSYVRTKGTKKERIHRLTIIVGDQVPSLNCVPANAILLEPNVLPVIRFE